LPDSHMRRDPIRWLLPFCSAAKWACMSATWKSGAWMGVVNVIHLTQFDDRYF
jgi:hypothetical protein